MKLTNCNSIHDDGHTLSVMGRVVVNINGHYGQGVVLDVSNSVYDNVDYGGKNGKVPINVRIVYGHAEIGAFREHRTKSEEAITIVSFIKITIEVVSIIGDVRTVSNGCEVKAYRKDIYETKGHSLKNG